MLTTYPGGKCASAPIDPHKTWWVDLVNPTNEEKAAASLPEYDDCLHRGRGGGPAVASGFRFDDYLVTVRYTELRSFNSVAATFAKPDAPRSAVETFAALSDAMADLCADTLEAIGAELDTISRSIFPKRGKGRKRLVAQTNDALRGLLIDVGNIGERSSRTRDILLGLQRIVPFVALPQRDWVPQQTQ